MQAVQGFAEPGFDELEAAFAELAPGFEEGGAGVCVYLEGRKSVHLWTGTACAYSPWQESTVAATFSATKGFIAYCAAVLDDRGLLDPDSPVASYWPEFAENGKADILVRHVLTHTAGVLGLPDPGSVLSWNGTGWDDYDAVAAQLAAAAPAWPPGTKTAYHALTYGWMVGELVRRVTGQTIGAFFASEVAEPLGLDAWIGACPERLRERLAKVVATAYSEEESDDLLAARAITRDPETLCGSSYLAMDGGSLLDNLELVEGDLSPGQGGASVQSLARFYAMLAAGGELDGTRLVSPETVKKFGTVRVRMPVAVEDLGLPKTDLHSGTAWALGFSGNDGPAIESPMYFGPSDSAFGHGGAGGQSGFCDPERGLGFGFIRSELEAESWGASAALIEALYTSEPVAAS
jgi:CubicO group peptidase (beta-lactamase class C family)